MEEVLAMSDFVMILRSPDAGWHNIWKMQIKVLWNNSRKQYCWRYSGPKTKCTVPGPEERL
jgi:hypothetical protein